VLGAQDTLPSTLRNVAKITDDRKSLRINVFFSPGPGCQVKGIETPKGQNRSLPAKASQRPDARLTITFAKRKGKNAVVLSEKRSEAENFRARNFPFLVHMTVTRNYGENSFGEIKRTASPHDDRRHSVTILIWLVLGFRSRSRGGGHPVTLALTLGRLPSVRLYPHRITLFALIFYFGILVDDAIRRYDEYCPAAQADAAKRKPSLRMWR